METIRITADLIEDRLDARYNAPSAVKIRKKIADSGLGSARICDLFNNLACGPFGSTLTSDEHEPNGEVLLIQPTNINSDLFSTDTEWRISERSRAAKQLALYPPETFLFARVGIYPHVGVLPAWVGPATIGSSIIAGECSSGIDPYFLLSFFRCAYGLPLLFAAQKVTAQPTIGTEEIGTTKVPKPRKNAQTYIGDKVRQAERLLEHARGLQAEAAAFFNLPGMDGIQLGESRAYPAASGVVDCIRLDPKFYDPGHFKLGELLRPLHPVSISELASPVTLQWEREEPEFFYLEIGELDLASGMITPSRLSTTDAPSRATTLVQPADVLVSTVRPNRKNVGLVMDVEEPLPIVASSGFSVLRFRSPEEAAFYLFWLRSDAATMQLMRWDAGSSYPAIDEGVPLKILVPRYLDDAVREKGARWHQSFQAQSSAEKLTDGAKLLVEALIEGKVTEAELGAAQEALERGDDTADRALLRRLTRHGLDVPGQPPLFPDLDALYALLAQTREAGQ